MRQNTQISSTPAMHLEKVLRWAIDIGMGALLLFLPAAFGSVHTWALTLAELTAFALLLMWLAKALTRGTDGLPAGSPMIAGLALLFMAIVSLQALPLPSGLIKMLSPSAFGVYTTAIPGYPESGAARSLSVYPYATLRSLTMLGACLALFTVASLEYRGKRRGKRLLIIITIAGVLEALYGLSNYLSGSASILWAERPLASNSAAGTFINRNHFAAYLALALFAALGVMTSTLRKASHGNRGTTLRHRIASLVNSKDLLGAVTVTGASIIIAIGIIFSLSRMGIISAIASLALILLFIYAKNTRAVVSMALAALLAVIALASVVSDDRPFERFVSGDSANRTTIWKSTWHIINDYPLTGSGLGTMESVIDSYIPPSFKVRPVHAHNDYLELIAEAGIPGSIVFLAAVSAFGVMVFLTKRESHPSAVVAGAGAFAYLAMHSLADFNLHIPAIAMTASVMMGLALARAGSSRGAARSQPPMSARTAIAAAIAVPLCAVLAFSTIRNLRAEYIAPSETNFTRPAPAANSAEALLAARTLTPGREDFAYQLGVLNTAVSPDQAIAWFAESARLNPYRLRGLCAMAETYAASAEFDSAMDAVSRALRIAPDHYLPNTSLAKIVIARAKSLPEDSREYYINQAKQALRKAEFANPVLRSNSAFQVLKARLAELEGTGTIISRIMSRGNLISHETVGLQIASAREAVESGKPWLAARQLEMIMDIPALTPRDKGRALAAIMYFSDSMPRNHQFALLAARKTAEAHMPNEALKYAERATGLKPKDAEGQFLHGEALLAAGKMDAARERYRMAVTLSGQTHSKAMDRLKSIGE